jgi:hypothetical protein
MGLPYAYRLATRVVDGLTVHCYEVGAVGANPMDPSQFVVQTVIIDPVDAAAYTTFLNTGGTVSINTGPPIDAGA